MRCLPSFQRSRFPCWKGIRFLSLLLAFLCLTTLTLADTARISGAIFTIDSNRIRVLWPNARITLKDLSSGREASTFSNDLGQYSFVGMLPGKYELTVTLAGFALATKQITVSAGTPASVDFQLVLQKQSTFITVSANPPAAHPGRDTPHPYHQHLTETGFHRDRVLCQEQEPCVGAIITCARTHGDSGCFVGKPEVSKCNPCRTAVHDLEPDQSHTIVGRISVCESAGN
jgi:hypothetical protein